MSFSLFDSNPPPSPCGYFLPQEIKKLNFNETNSLTILHVNIRGLKTNFEKLLNLLPVANTPFNILALSETNLKSLDDDSFFYIKDYSMVHSVKSDSSGRGTCFYISDSLHYDIIQNATITNCESLWIEVSLPLCTKTSKLIIGSLYRSPSSPIMPFIESLDFTLHNISAHSKNVILCGDLSIDLLPGNSYTSQYGVTYSDVLHSYRFSQCIDKPTRCTTTIQNLIRSHIYQLHLQNLLRYYHARHQ